MPKKLLLRGLVLALLVGGYFLHIKWPAVSDSEASDSNAASLETSVVVESVVAEGSMPEDISDGVIGVDAIASATGQYTFSVTLQSPDTGCDAYANWWEVITPEGELLYRRILAHSHVDEQPFTRSGGPVEIDAEQAVIVRSHMHPTGYSPQAMQGSADGRFEPTTLTKDFAQALAQEQPQPSGCAF